MVDGRRRRRRAMGELSFMDMSDGKRQPLAADPAAGASSAALADGAGNDRALLAGFAAALLVAVSAVLVAPLVGIGWAAPLAGLAVAASAAATWRLAVRPMAALRAVHARAEPLAQITAASPEGRLLVGPGGEAVYANPAYRTLTGAGAEGAPPLPADLVAGDETARERLMRLERAAVDVAGGRDEVAVQGGEGRRRWLSLAAHPLAGLPGHVVWYVSDTTLWHELQEAIQHEQDKLADFIDNAPVGFYSVDQDGRFLFVNQTLARWTGYSADELSGASMRVGQVLVPDQASAARLVPSAADADLPDCEAKLKARNGGIRPVRITQSVVVDTDGSLRTRSVVRDLTQELEWRQALRQAEQHFRRFFDFAPIAIIVVDRAGKVLEANEAFRRLTGAAPGQPLGELVREDDKIELAARLSAVRHGDSRGQPLEVRFRGAGERVAQLYAAKFDDGPAGEATLLIHLIDTTDQKNLEVQFAQSQKMQAVGQLAGGIAHDFNNLLTAMIGFCDLLLLRHQPGDQSFADVMQIKQNANRAANLVRQLLAFSRQQTLRPKVLDLTDVLADLRNLLSRLLGERIELKILHGRDLGPVKVDQGQLEQVIINLAVNARDAMPDGGALTIRTAAITAEESTRLGHELMPAGEYLLIEVIDTGKGIAKENLGKIFEPFFTTKAVGEGTGLGLSTVYGIIKQTGGFIFPESAVGQGATFRIYLPRYRPTAAEALARDEAAQDKTRDLTGKGTLLLVEDEDAVRTFAARALRNKGYTVLEANSGESALKLIERDKTTIDLLISDVVMPNMDGPTLAQHIRQSRPDLRIIFISGYAEEAFRKNPGAPQDTSFLPKPFSLSQLAGKVKEVLGAPR